MLPSLLIHFNIYITAEFYNLGVLGTAQLKGIAVLQPLVGNFQLIAVFDFLLEHSIMVADTAAVCHIAQGRQRIQEASRQSAKTAVSQRRIRLLILNQVQITAQLFQGFFHAVIKCQVNQVIAQGPAHQKLHGHIIYDLRIFLLYHLLGGQPGVNHRILGRQRYRMKNLLLRGLLHISSVKGFYIVHYTSFEHFLVKRSLAHVASPPALLLSHIHI